MGLKGLIKKRLERPIVSLEKSFEGWVLTRSHLNPGDQDLFTFIMIHRTPLANMTCEVAITVISI